MALGTLLPNPTAMANEDTGGAWLGSRVWTQPLWQSWEEGKAALPVPRLCPGL